MSKSNVSLVEVFGSASAADLASIDATIAEIRDTIAGHEKTITGLQAIRKALDFKLNGKKPRAPKEPRPVTAGAPKPKTSFAPPRSGSAGNGALTPGERIAAAIRANGPMSKTQLADELKLMSTVVAVAVSRSHALEERGGLVHVVPGYDD